MTGMIQDEENDYGMTDCVRNDIPKGSVKSLRPPPSAEGGGWSDFPLWMTGMIRDVENDYGMTECGWNDIRK